MYLHDFLTKIEEEWSAFLLHIQEVLGSSIDPESGYPASIFIIFLSPSSQMLRYNLQLCYDCFFHVLPN
jgi:hypothetical protein